MATGFALICVIEYCLVHVRRACGHVDVGMCQHQVLAATLTLSQPGGGAIMATLYWCPHQVLKATGVPAPNLIVVLI